MRRVHTKKVAVIFATTAEEFERKMNERLASEKDNLASDQKIIYNITNGGFSASVEYTILELIPETARDIQELRGEFLFCEDCPHLTNELNAKGHHKCKRGTTMPTMRACNWFCERYEREEEFIIERVDGKYFEGAKTPQHENLRVS